MYLLPSDLTSSVTCWILLISLTLIIGSFLNVLIFRLPQMVLNDPTENPQRNINLFLPRSFCPNCRKTIKAWQNIPILSFFLLQGRCRSCQKRISWHYPLNEALFLGLAIWAAFFLGFTLNYLFALIFIANLICIFWIDIDHQIIPDELSLGLLWMGLIASDFNLFVPLSTAVYGAISGYLSLWLFTHCYYLISGKWGMGHGDFKLFAAFGAWFGPFLLLHILILASISGLVIGSLYLKLSKQKQSTPIPFGPYLCLAAGLVFFNHLNDFYCPT